MPPAISRGTPRSATKMPAPRRPEMCAHSRCRLRRTGWSALGRGSFSTAIGSTQHRTIRGRIGVAAVVDASLEEQTATRTAGRTSAAAGRRPATSTRGGYVAEAERPLALPAPPQGWVCASTGSLRLNTSAHDARCSASAVLCAVLALACARNVAPDRDDDAADIHAPEPAVDVARPPDTPAEPADDVQPDTPDASDVECVYDPLGMSFSCRSTLLGPDSSQFNGYFRCCAGRCVAATACPIPDADVGAQCGLDLRACDMDAGELCCVIPTSLRYSCAQRVERRCWRQ